MAALSCLVVPSKNKVVMRRSESEHLAGGVDTNLGERHVLVLFVLTLQMIHFQNCA